MLRRLRMAHTPAASKYLEPQKKGNNLTMYDKISHIHYAPEASDLHEPQKINE
jgi:hypothetical protein